MPCRKIGLFLSIKNHSISGANAILKSAKYLEDLVLLTLSKVVPPSTIKVCPVIQDASLVHKK